MMRGTWHDEELRDKSASCVAQETLDFRGTRLGEEDEFELRNAHHENEDGVHTWGFLIVPEIDTCPCVLAALPTHFGISYHDVQKTGGERRTRTREYNGRTVSEIRVAGGRLRGRRKATVARGGGARPWSAVDSPRQAPWRACAMHAASHRRRTDDRDNDDDDEFVFVPVFGEPLHGEAGSR